MRHIAKRLIPDPILKRLRAEQVRHNRRALARASKSGAPLALVPDNLVEHYYHFLFDLALPLFLLVEATGRDARFTVQTTPGPFLARLHLLFGNQVDLAPVGGGLGGAAPHVMFGMNPFLVAVTSREARAFAQHVRSVVGAGSSPARTKVLLIERLPPDGFFTAGAVKPGGGASRRCITNHEEIDRTLRSIVRPPFDVQTVQLERVPFEDQIRLFADAAAVIGQHGAGLANCLWMQPGSVVVELNHDPSKSHFETVSHLMGHTYVAHRTDGTHVSVDVDRLAGQLRRDESLSAVFGHA
jgi:hypothetical protein